ncbi:hypothetical protein UCRPA7_2432 [Phaeoacremonium minimum UCRPA7]|uniref:Uncharacterized protein n=1 Tax=Phaeoacremonium minimum (strain UCR-PA7) TaxID=1286976 RepID=R8BRP1_PHAM7|nr:hypothetical protein UCRPA7_2432 [Phaeoacremonium minimum UCRPA7]EOO02048.1 hypothetical protein UCRPA7_2432 [Phaeoacremonium minimum UCRPA7]
MFSRFGEMDDLYLPLGHPASSTGPRYSDAGSQGLDTSFSFMDPQMVSEDPAAMDGFRTAHDDLCLDRPDCLTLGVYNTPDVFHRNPPSHMAFRARHSLPIAPAGHNIPQTMYQPDMFGNVSYADIQQMQTPNSLQNAAGAFANPFETFSQVESHGMPWISHYMARAKIFSPTMMRG